MDDRWGRRLLEVNFITSNTRLTIDGFFGGGSLTSCFVDPADDMSFARFLFGLGCVPVADCSAVRFFGIGEPAAGVVKPLEAVFALAVDLSSCEKKHLTRWQSALSGQTPDLRRPRFENILRMDDGCHVVMVYGCGKQRQQCSTVVRLSMI